MSNLLRWKTVQAVLVSFGKLLCIFAAMAACACLEPRTSPRKLSRESLSLGILAPHSNIQFTCNLASIKHLR